MKKGFTLIELLVVIAIIAILAAILFPVFAQAREKARATSCLSNCKQMGTGLTLYCDDYDEAYPLMYRSDDYIGYSSLSDDLKVIDGKTIKYGYTDWTSAKYGHYSFYNCLLPYVKNRSMFICPSGEKYTCGYAMNQYLGGWKAGASTDPDTYTPLTQSEIKNTAELVAFSDALQQPGGDMVLNSEPYVLADNPKNYDANLTWTIKEACRHNGGSNYTMADGHAKFYKFGSGPTYVLKSVRTWDSCGTATHWFNYQWDSDSY